MILHFSHMGLTDGLTFILFNLHLRTDSLKLLTSPNDPALAEIIGRHLNRYFVTGQDFNIVRSELAGNVCPNDVSVAEFNIELSIPQRIGYDALDLDYVVLSQVRNLLGYSLVTPGLRKPGLFVTRC